MAKHNHPLASAKPKADPTPPAKKNSTPLNEHTEDFFSAYANNIRFESTVYDLKLVFGETDLSSGIEVTKQHTAITLPWALVKVALYFIEVNLLIHELANGKVTVPPNQIPPPATAVPPEMADDPNAAKAREIVTKLRQEFIDKL